MAAKTRKKYEDNKEDKKEEIRDSGCMQITRDKEMKQRRNGTGNNSINFDKH